MGICIPLITISTWKIILTRCAMDMMIKRNVTMVVAGFMIDSFLTFYEIW
jgi:hypothetical protein